jgi:hypothetical protein
MKPKGKNTKREKMIKQIYTKNNETFEIIINSKKVFYRDRKVGAIPIQVIPKDPRVEKRILTSRNRIDKNLIKQFELTKTEQEEYDNALKSGEDIENKLAEICKKDCKTIGSILQKEVRI